MNGQTNCGRIDYLSASPRLDTVTADLSAVPEGRQVTVTLDVDAKAGGHSVVRGQHLTTRNEELYFLVRPDPPV